MSQVAVSDFMNIQAEQREHMESKLESEQETVSKFEENFLSQGKVKMFTCGTPNLARIKAIDVLDRIGVDYEVVDMKRCEIGAMQLHSGYTSLPSIYFGNEHIGGYDDLMSLTRSENKD